MAIRIIQDKTAKKKKTTRKTTTKKSSSITRHTTMTISRKKINIVKGNNNKFIKKLVRRIIALLFVVSLAFSSVYAYNHWMMPYLCSLERFFIDTIEVTGCKNVTESEIINLVPFDVGQSSFEVNLGRLEKDLKESKPELKNVFAHRTNKFKKVVISLTERVPEVFVTINDEKKGLDFDNKPFNLKGDMSDMKIPTIIFNDEEEKLLLLNFYKRIKNYISDIIPGITEIKHSKLDDIILTMNNKTIIYWGLDDKNKNEKKATRLQQVIKDLNNKNKDAKSIDLSFIDSNKNKIIVDIVNEEQSI